MLKRMTKMDNSLVGYIVLLRKLAFLCKCWVGDHSISEDKWDTKLSSEHSLRSLHLIIWADGSLVSEEVNCLAKAVSISSGFTYFLK